MKKLFKKLALMVVALLTFSVGSNYTVKEVKAADGAGSWTLVKDASVLSVGDKVVIAAAAQSSKYAMSVTQNNNNRASVVVEKVGETLTYIASIQTLTLEAGTKENTYAFNTGDGYLYAASSKSNYLKTGSKNDNASWTIEITNDGVATIKAQGTNTRNWMRFNSSNNPPLFSCYGSGQADICLYKFTESVVANTTEDKIKANDTLAYLGFDYSLEYDMVKIPGKSSLVTDAATLSVGDKIVIAAFNADFAMSVTQNNNNRPQEAITKNDDNTIDFDSSVQVLTLEQGTIEGTFAFNTGDESYLYAASSSSNHLKTGFKNDNASWTIEITNAGVATIKAQGTNSRNWMRYNSQSGLFSCYGSGQADICLYKASGEKEVEGLVSSKFDNISILFGATVDSELFKDYNSVSGGVYICAGETFDASKAVKKPVSIEAGKGYSVGAVLNIIEDGKPVDSSTKERLSQKFTAVVYFEVNGQELLLNSKTVCVKDMVDIYLSDDYSNEQSIKENKIALEELQAFIKSASGGN